MRKQDVLKRASLALAGAVAAFSAASLLSPRPLEAPPPAVAARPFAAEPLVVSSAGQGGDAYILHDLALSLRLDARFAPAAEADDLEDAGALALALGINELGLAMRASDEERELERVRELLDEAEARGIPVIAVALSKRRGSLDRELARIVCDRADYVIIANPSDPGKAPDWLPALPADRVSMVGRIADAAQPLASAFR